MPGCFGLLDGYHASYFPRHLLVEHRAARLDSFELNRNGVLLDRAETEVRVGPVGYRLATRRPNLWSTASRSD